MAYNSYSNNKDANKPFEPSIYSPYRFNNAESEIDKTCLTFGVWKQMLKISISPKKEGTEEIQFDMEKGLTVYLNHSKAKILSTEIQNFLRDPDTYTGSGVPSGQGIITISNGAELGGINPVLIIRKVDDTGSVISSIAYEFKKDYYFSVRNYTGGTEFSKENDTYKNLEIEEMIRLLEEYCDAMTYMTAYSVMDANKWNEHRTSSRLLAIAEKLGVEVNRSSSKGSGYSSTSFFSSAGSSMSAGDGYTSASIDDID